MHMMCNFQYGKRRQGMLI